MGAPALWSCHREPELTAAEKRLICASARETLEAYHADVRKDGLMAEFKYLDDSKDFFWVPPGYSSAISFDSVSAVLRQNSSTYALIDNAWDTLLIIPLDKNLASYSGRLRSTVTDTVGNVSSFHVVETGLLIKRDSGWKLLSGQTTTIEKR